MLFKKKRKVVTGSRRVNYFSTHTGCFKIEDRNFLISGRCCVKYSIFKKKFVNRACSQLNYVLSQLLRELFEVKVAFFEFSL